MEPAGETRRDRQEAPVSWGPPMGPSIYHTGDWALASPFWPLSQTPLTPASFLKTVHLSLLLCPGHLVPRPVGASRPFLPLPLGSVLLRPSALLNTADKSRSHLQPSSDTSRSPRKPGSLRPAKPVGSPPLHFLNTPLLRSGPEASFPGQPRAHPFSPPGPWAVFLGEARSHTPHTVGAWAPRP